MSAVATFTDTSTLSSNNEERKATPEECICGCCRRFRCVMMHGRCEARGAILSDHARLLGDKTCAAGVTISPEIPAARPRERVHMIFTSPLQSRLCVRIKSREGLTEPNQRSDTIELLLHTPHVHHFVPKDHAQRYMIGSRSRMFYLRASIIS